MATKEIRPQFDCQNLSPQTLLTTESPITSPLQAAPLLQTVIYSLNSFSLGVIIPHESQPVCLPVALAFPALIPRWAPRRWTGPAKPSLVLDSLTDLARPKSQLIRENALLRQQLLTLRVQRQVKRPHFNRQDRFFLLVLASRVTNWKQALVLLQPDTLLRWHRAGVRLFWQHKAKPKTAQPKIERETIELIQQMAQENLLWGAGRIRGELRKLGIQVAKRTIQKYMRPVRGTSPRGQTWVTFLKNHAQDIWACDFLPVVDLFFRSVFLFFIVELGSRRVVHFGVTRHPTEVWVAQQLREATPYGEGPKYLIRDNDAKFGTRFDEVAKETGSEVLRIPYRAPRANAVCERFLGSVRRECLDHLLVFSERQFYRVIKEYVAYFNRARPHQRIGQMLPDGAKGEKEIVATGNIIPFPGGSARRKNPERQQRESPEGKPQSANGKIIGLPVLGGLRYDYRRVA